jgi:hypothetical protein
VEVVVELE